MLTSLLGIRLVLWMGPTVPIPAPPEVLSALSRVEVTQDVEGAEGFSLTFTLGKDKSLEYGLLTSGSLQPFCRVVIGVVLGVMPEVLMDGVITHYQLQPGNEPGSTSLTVIGRDVSVMLDLEEKNESFPNQPDFLIVNRILATYAQYGLVPVSTPTSDVPIMLQRIPRQQETDLCFLQRLARRNGFVFYIEPLTFGMNQAHFGPENRMGIPQPALSVDLGSSTNVSSLSFSNDQLAPVGTQGTFVEPLMKMAIPIPSLPSLRVPPLASSSVSARRTVQLRSSANQSPIQAALAAVSAVTTAPEAVRGEGEVDTVRYGSVLRARRLVGVRGAGRSYNGLYYVRRVTHTVEWGETPRYTQRFTLSREGTGTLVPVVRP
jgi:hypothetical protein